MKSKKTASKDLYYTRDHEWIDFQGSIAYVGVCQLKLTGCSLVDEIIFNVSSGFIKKSDVVATIYYSNRQVEVHTPVDGKIAEINENLKVGNRDTLLLQAESAGWIARVIPSHPYDRKDLLLPKEYQMNGKGKYAK